MSATVTIGGVDVDIDDPCAVLTELRKAEIIVAAGESVSMSRFGDEEVRFSAGSSRALSDLIARYEALCDRKCGRRRRFAKGVRWR